MPVPTHVFDPPFNIIRSSHCLDDSLRLPPDLTVTCNRPVVSFAMSVLVVIPGWSEGPDRNLEIPGSSLRAAPE